MFVVWKLRFGRESFKGQKSNSKIRPTGSTTFSDRNDNKEMIIYRKFVRKQIKCVLSLSNALEIIINMHFCIWFFFRRLVWYEKTMLALFDYITQ